MKSKYNKAAELSKAIGDFLSDYAPSHLTSSEHTLRSYETALALYIGYLEEACEVTPDKFTKECFDQEHIEKWLKWLQEERNCSADTCNNRLSAFLQNTYPHIMCGMYLLIPMPLMFHTEKL